MVLCAPLERFVKPRRASIGAPVKMATKRSFKEQETARAEVAKL